jgi:ubiquinone/menaquinone biosynthesis C-methylase UbiE
VSARASHIEREEDPMEHAHPIPLAVTHPNPVRGRVNAAFFRFMDWYMHWKYAAMKRRLFADLPETVLEIGAGTGANFRYLQPGTRVVAVEPNHYMHGTLEETARRHELDLSIRGGGAEVIPMPDESVDAVICSLVLCTVDDPRDVVTEVRRVLRPGGRFVCIEHVAAPHGSALHRLQRAVFRPWRWFFEGCHTHRDTERTLREAGFDRVEIERFDWPTAFLPVRPQIAAICQK